MGIIKTVHLIYEYIRHDEEEKVAEVKRAIDGVDLEIEEGSFTAILGHNGSGKSTLAKHINGLLLPTEGTVWVGEIDTKEEDRIWDVRKTAGMVFQNPDNQIIGNIVEEDVGFGPENIGVPTDEIWKRVDESLKAVGMTAYRKQSPNKLSGGQKQRVAIAGVMAMRPRCIILDEPTANLDRETIERLHDQIAYLKSRGHTILIAEHRLYFLADLIDRAVYLRDGIVERIWSGAEFRRLAETERIALGLRTLTPTQVTLPPSRAAGEQDGLSVEGLSCRYKREPPVFQNLSFSARPGEVLAVTGDNGVGKSTLSRCLCGLMRESAGTIRLNGRILGAKQRQRIAYCVMQDVNHQLFSDSVWGECQLAMEGLSDQRIQEVLERLHLLAFREKHPMSLSGGQKQRLAVATAMLSQKPLLVFDEPTSGLDYARMQEVACCARELADEGRVVLVVTHDREFLQCACDRVLEL